MSNLPHPLGDSSAGDLFYPGSPQVVAADSPGAAGSRAVEFGEDGLSSAVNRGLYALGKNDEYIQERMEEQIARPDFVTFTPAGGNGDEYTFSADVWCGDTFYTPEDQSVRDSLISVLDEKYNDLIDPTTGDKIVVREIKDALSVSQVGSGFSTNPIVTFRKVDPVTGALGANYTIPDGTVVWLAFGRAATLDELTTDTNVRDSWFRGFCRSVGEIHAGSFLKDGSRKATGNFDLDNNLLDVVERVRGASGVALTLEATGASPAHLNLLSSNEVQFRDTHLGGYLSLNDGDSALGGDHTSVLTSLNSKTAVLNGAVGMGLLNNASITFTDATGEISWAEMYYISPNGDRIVVAADSLNATDSQQSWLAINTGTGLIEEVASASLTMAHIPLYYYYWIGASFVQKYDVRRLHDGRTNGMVVTVGVGDCDFANNRLQEALDFITLIRSVGLTPTTAPPRIRIIGAVDATAAQLVIRGSCVIEGDDQTTSQIFTTDDETVSAIDCGLNQVVFKNLTMVAASMSGADNQVSCFYRPGSSSRFENIFFAQAGTDSYKVVFLADSTAVGYIHIRNCGTLSGHNVGGLLDSLTTGKWTFTHIEKCVIDANGLGGTRPDGLITHVGDSLWIDDCYFIGDANVTNAVRVGHNSHLHGNVFILNTASDGVLPYRASGSGEFVLNFENNYFLTAGKGISFDEMSGANTTMKLVARGNTFNAVLVPFSLELSVSLHQNSWTRISKNHVYNCTSFLLTDNDIRGVYVEGNFAYYIEEYFALFPTGGVVSAVIRNNYIDSWDYTPNDTPCIHYQGTDTEDDFCLIENNVFIAGHTGSGYAIHAEAGQCRVEANLFSRSVEPDTWIYMEKLYGSCVVGNYFGSADEHGVYLHNSGSVSTDHHFVFSGNHFDGVSAAGFACLYIAGFGGVTVSSNSFGDGTRWLGRAIHIAESGSVLPYGVTVDGNVIRGSKGQGSTSATLYVQNFATDYEGLIISNNSFVECGDDPSADTASNIIYMGGSGVISGNSFVDSYGSSNDGGSAVQAIINCAVEHIVVSSNYIFQDLVDGKTTLAHYKAIVLNANCSCCNNFLKFHGDSGTAGPDQFYAIDMINADASIVMGNWIGGDSETADDASGYNSIIGTNADECVVMGNYCGRHAFAVQSGSGGAVIGNVMTSAATFIVGGGHLYETASDNDPLNKNNV